MPNPNPKTAQLALGRGKRPKLNHQTVGMRMSPQTRHHLDKIASAYGCFYGGKPWIAGLLEKIASGELVVVPAPAIILDPQESAKSNPLPLDSKQAMKKHLEQKHYPISSERDQTTASENVDDPEPLSVS